MRSHHHAGADQRTGLACVHLFQQPGRRPGPLDGQVDRLATRHALRAAGFRQRADNGQALRRVRRHRPVLSEDLEGQDLERIAGEDRGRLVESLVAGRPTPAQVVIVHRRQIVMDERIGMDQFHRRSRAVQPGRVHADRLAGQIDQQRADPLAAAEYRIAHRLVEPVRTLIGRRQPAFKNALDAVAVKGERPLEVH